MRHEANRRTIALAATLALAAAIQGAGEPLAASADAKDAASGVRFTLKDPPYTLATNCDLSGPLAFVDGDLSASGIVANDTLTIDASDDSGSLAGGAPLPVLTPFARPIVIPLRHVANNAGAIPGVHAVTISIGTRTLAKVAVTIPPSLCGSSAAPSGSITHVSDRPRVIPYAGATKGPFASIEGSTTAKNRRTPELFALASPSNITSARTGTDCAAHVGLVGALVCPDMMKSGNLLLVWDWQPGTGPDQIDGFRVYRVDAGLKRLVDTRPNKTQQTLADVPPPPGGFGGTCYSVSAFVGKRESDLGTRFCAGGGSFATTVRLTPSHIRTSFRRRTVNGGFDTSYEGTVVGYNYWKDEKPLGDEVANTIYRSAFAFDVLQLLNRRVIAATLRVGIVRGAYSQDSCVTSVVAGAGAWWENTGWIEQSRFAVPASPAYALGFDNYNSGFAVDVTSIVQPWFVARQNFGLVLENDDENLQAFTDKTCVTELRDPVLDVTYY